MTRFQLEMPELTEFPNDFPGHWMNILFTKTRPDTYQIHALTTTYVRLVEAAMEDYRLARGLVDEVWVHRDPSSIPIGAHNRASAYLEACLTNMHRAVRCMNKIRNRPDVPSDLKSLIPQRVRFTEPLIADRIRDVRDAVHHLEEKVLKGRVPEQTPFMVQAVGPETPVREEPGQTLKTIDRLQIGSHEIKFLELYAWLLEMGECAEKISKYQRT